LGQYSKGDPQRSSHLRQPKKSCEALTHSQVFAALVGLKETPAAAVEEHHRHHDAKQEQSEVGELAQLREVIATPFGRPISFNGGLSVSRYLDVAPLLPRIIGVPQIKFGHPVEVVLTAVDFATTIWHEDS